MVRGMHNILYAGIGEFKDIVNHFPFIRFNLAVFMADIHVGLQFTFGNGIHLFIGVHMQKL